MSRAQLLENIDLSKRILEIGPLAWPNIKKENGTNVFYADIRSTEDVKNHYKNDQGVPYDEIVDIDFVVNGSYTESLKDVEKFDYIIATHVIEHIPQLILFFQDISNVLKPHGKLFLAIPDKRFCFDHFRCPTSFAECYDIYKRGISNQPFRVLDYFSSTTINDPGYWHRVKSNFEYLPNDKKKFNLAMEYYLKALNGEYIDIHFSVFTPETFLLLVYNMLMFNLFPYRCIEFRGTDNNALEFDCVFELEPNLLIENSIENKQERENLLDLLNKNNDHSDSIIKLEHELQMIKSSTSWKITAPLRNIKNALLRKRKK